MTAMRAQLCQGRSNYLAPFAEFIHIFIIFAVVVVVAVASGTTILYHPIQAHVARQYLVMLDLRRRNVSCRIVLPYTLPLLSIVSRANAMRLGRQYPEHRSTPTCVVVFHVHIIIIITSHRIQ